MLSVLDSGLSGLGSSSGRGYCVVLLCYIVRQDTSLSQSLSPPRCINGYRRI